MSGYPMEWRGSVEPEDKSGEAIFMVDGEQFTFRLPSFLAASAMSDALNLAFEQGKRFMFKAMQDHVSNAMRDCASSRGVTT